ncbi:hypothetical protein J2Z22_001280 [Paenibacillus forsythiae]|uniref:DUF2933 domain-containing protein n=1 Tax=Paenibacillus forsythiae TaxID=365616 RepID=A0ABU3H5K5_9BACL|nr:DUF2933 domain-containing protein [Paenibacillus forsythiae]MDT3425761.1 hypothetical protein [Paenibacillus forsythiae]
MNWSSLLVLVCPLMMIFMMFGMKGMHGHGHGKNRSHGVSAPDADVRRELDELKVQNEQMKRELERLAACQKAE